MLLVIIAYLIFSPIEGLILRKGSAETVKLYDFEHLTKSNKKYKSLIIDDSRNADDKLLQTKYDITQESDNKIESSIDDDRIHDDYVIIKSRKKKFNIGPYNMIRRLDDVKYMIIWLNMYCEMHPECDKRVLNEQLRQVVSAVGEQRMDEMNKN